MKAPMRGKALIDSLAVVQLLRDQQGLVGAIRLAGVQVGDAEVEAHARIVRRLGDAVLVQRDRVAPQRGALVGEHTEARQAAARRARRTSRRAAFAHAAGSRCASSHSHAAASSMRPASGRYMRRSTARSAIGITDDVGARMSSVQPTAKVKSGCVRALRTATTTSATAAANGISTPTANGVRASGQS